jgi:hypothetical protein
LLIEGTVGKIGSLFAWGFVVGLSPEFELPVGRFIWLSSSGLLYPSVSVSNNTKSDIVQATKRIIVVIRIIQYFCPGHLLGSGKPVFRRGVLFC